MSTFNLSSALIDQFVKVTKDEKEVKTENTHYGTIVAYDGKHYVKIDGSDQLTPIPVTTTNVKDGERVRVTIKNHALTVTGNISNPSATTGEMQEVEKQVGDISDQITEFEIVIADKVSTKDLEAETARIDQLIADDVVIKGELEAAKGNIKDLETETLNVTNKLTAAEGEIETLKTTTLTAEKANLYPGGAGLYSFFEDAVMYDPYATESGIVKYDVTGKPWYYVDGHIRKDAGLVYVQRGDLTGNYIFVTFSGTLKKGSQSIKEKTCNGHTEFIGTQRFDSTTGAMIIK